MEVGTPVWTTGFGCVTWVGQDLVGVALLANGEPKVTGCVPLERAEEWAQKWRDVCQEDGRIAEVVVH